MKRKFRTLLIASLLVTAPLLMMAQAPPHPNGGAAPSGANGNGPVGGGAPVGSGVVILIAMGAVYGALKLYQMRNTVITEE